MNRKKARLSHFSSLVRQINEHDGRPSASNCHLIDNEYFAAFDSLDAIQKFHAKVNEQPAGIVTDDESEAQQSEDVDMKLFAQQYLVDLPEQINRLTGHLEQKTVRLLDNKKRKSTAPMKLSTERTNKRPRRHIRDLPQSSEFIYTNDNDDQYETNVDNEPAERVQHDSPREKGIRARKTDAPLTSPSLKKEPLEPEQTMVEPKAEPLEVQVPSGDAMSFGTSQFTGDLDNYVQNIHLRRQPSSANDSTPSTSSRPQRIRKKKRLSIEESEPPPRSRKIKTPIRKKQATTTSTPSALPLTDAEIEQQFGERLPLIKSEQSDHDDAQQLISSRVVIEFEPVARLPQTPIEKARAKLTAALERGHEPDTYLLKIRSREHKIIEMQLAIYGTADWHPQRTKILAKIEEALRGLRVSWTKIDVVVGDFDIQISTSSRADTVAPATSAVNSNSSWFLKVLSESGPLIVHIHDRRCPQQRFLSKCSCPECSPASIRRASNSSLPIVVSTSPATTPTRRLSTPSILQKPAQSGSLPSHNIATTFFNDLIHQHGRNTVVAVTQCVLDLALIVSVHASLPSLCVPPTFAKDDYKKKYQQIIDPLKCTLTDNDKVLLKKTPMIARVVSMHAANNTPSIVLSKAPDILRFYQSIQENNANIRSAKSMRSLINTSFSPASQSNVIHAQTLVLPKPTASVSLAVIETRKPTERVDSHKPKQQAICTTSIELKPIASGSAIATAANTELTKGTPAKPSESQAIVADVIPTVHTGARVIRLAITKPIVADTRPVGVTASSVTPPSTIRLVAPSKLDAISLTSAVETVPLVPKQINIIKPFSSASTSLAPAFKLANPILIANKLPSPPTK